MLEIYSRHEVFKIPKFNLQPATVNKNSGDKMKKMYLLAIIANIRGS